MPIARSARCDAAGGIVPPRLSPWAATPATASNAQRSAHVRRGLCYLQGVLRRVFALAAAAIAGACQAPAPAADEVAAAPATPASSGPSPTDIRRDGNHLRGEPSPYLQQHAHNPIDWYPWGSEALDRAAREGKPIFLSIGYATCHWCHVMERETFSDDVVAQFINDHFVAIKVDREQRPDVDALYLEAIAGMGGATGWPLNVFLTSSRVPILGGTYFPREGDGQRPGFLDLAREVEASWRAQGEDAARRGRAVLDRLAAADRQPGNPQLGEAELNAAIDRLARLRDDARGGFGSRQKFPHTPVLLAELRWAVRADGPDRDEAREHLVTTLEAMRDGGLRDQLAGTFHRYTVDAGWQVPHFEKMLYDNAQLAAVYLEAGRAFGRPDFVATARAVLDELLENWRVEGGGFVVGFDADDELGEGRFYTWTRSELDALLAPTERDLVARAFAIDEHGPSELHGRSVLRRQSDAAVATATSRTEDGVRTAVEKARGLMLAARAQRPKPQVDDKIVVGWNALAIAALADASRWLDEPRYREAAEQAAAFITSRCTDPDGLQRGVRDTVSLGPAQLEDIAALAWASLRLHAATGAPEHLTSARELAQLLVDHHFDRARGGFRRRRDPSDLPLDPLDMRDGVQPSGGALAAAVLLELGALAGDDLLSGVATTALASRRDAIADDPLSHGMWLVVLDQATASLREVVIAGEPGDPAAAALWREAAVVTWSRGLPVRVPAAGAPQQWLTPFPALAGKKALGGRATAYVCERGACQLPTSDPSVLRQQLGLRRPATSSR